MFFDTHAHYTDEAFNEDSASLLKAVHASGVELIVNAGNDEKTSLASMALAEEYDFVYAAVGWHPEDAVSFDPDASPELIKSWCNNKKVVAIGEIGLDYYYDEIPKDVQKAVFVRQMELARELRLPVVIHDREAHGDCLEIVKSFPEVTGAFHCYSGSADMAKELLKLGWYLGFTGVVTFKNARKTIETLEICPLERILIETDCPYLAPVPNRGHRNDSRNLEFTARKIAEVKGVSETEIARISLENGKRMYGIK